MSEPLAVRLSAPATQRNRGPIFDLLGPRLPRSGLVLEVASGTGEHVVHFAALRPDLVWQPSDPSPEARASVAAWIAGAGLPNIRAPLALDAGAQDWPLPRADAVICMNMLHISPWAATEGLMRGAGALLPQEGLLFVYGAFLQAGVATAPSNLAFDADLRRRDPRWGLRDLAAVAACAAAAGLVLTEVFRMPAHNLSLVFRRRGP